MISSDWVVASGLCEREELWEGRNMSARNSHKVVAPHAVQQCSKGVGGELRRRVAV